jgi:hypothetical protein
VVAFDGWTAFVLYVALDAEFVHRGFELEAEAGVVDPFVGRSFFSDRCVGRAVGLVTGRVVAGEKGDGRTDARAFGEFGRPLNDALAAQAEDGADAG